jgi:uncharacterized membrane protein
MPADAIVDSELKSLREQLAAAGRPTTAAQAEPPPAADGERRQPLAALADELADEATRLFEELEKDVAAHPTASVIAALLAGIAIGLMLRRS